MPLDRTSCRRHGNVRVPWKHVSLVVCLEQLSLFFLLACGPLRVMGHVEASELPLLRGRLRSYETRGSARALLCEKAGSRAEGHMTVSEPTSIWRWVRSRGIRGITRAHLNKEVGSGAKGHVISPEPTSTRRWGSELKDTWHRQSPPQQRGGV
jgi:hypothetical protein